MVSSKLGFSNSLLDVEQVSEKIARGDYLIVAADESRLRELPPGNWVGGTIPYFMAEQGGVVSRDKVFVTEVSPIPSSSPPRLMIYDENTIERIAVDSPEHGFTVLIVPAASDVHQSYAEHAPEFPNMYFTPIIGWVSGVHLDDLDRESAKTAFGPAGGELMAGKAVAMHVPLPQDQVAQINTINLFEPGVGPTIQFPETGLTVGDCLVDGVKLNFAEYLQAHNIDTRLPLVADYSGIMMNVSIQKVGDVSQPTCLYAPVFSEVSYRFAEPIGDYIQKFEAALPANLLSGQNSYSCNCILNFLYSELEGRSTKNITGPITFGEIAYQLVNQTLAYLTVTSSAESSIA